MSDICDITNGNIVSIHNNMSDFVTKAYVDAVFEPYKYCLPTDQELEKYPTLKSTWHEYLMTRRLLGL